MIDRLCRFLVPVLVAALLPALCAFAAAPALAKSDARTKEAAVLWSPKLPAEGPSAMHWPGLDLVDHIATLAGNAAAANAPLWRPVAAPGMKAPAASDARSECDLFEGWTFIAIDSSTSQPEKPRATSLPDRWSDARDYTAGWYTRRVSLAPRDGQRIVACFEQVSLFCVLFVNGVPCGRHLGAYTPLEFDITGAAKNGDNVLALYVHDASGALAKDRAFNQVGDFKKTSPKPLIGGVWGAVRLQRRPTACVSDVFVKTSTRRHELTAVCELVNLAAQPLAARLDFALLDWPGGTPVPLAIPSQPTALPPGKTTTLTVTVPWTNPRLWSPDHPNLYVLRTTLVPSPSSSMRCDVVDTRFGFREFWAEGKQFLLNGVPTRLFGESHTYWALSRGAPDPVSGRDYCREMFLQLKKRFRGNAARLAARIMPHNVLLGADEAGYLLLDQSSIWSTDLWWYRNAGEMFLANTRREFAEWTRRDRNNPSAVIWDVENEQIRMGKAYVPWALQFDKFARENDDTRLIEHDGAGWYDHDQQIIHLHMDEHYSDILQQWQARGDKPLVAGEFWVGGQGSLFLPSSIEFRSAPEWTFEEARLTEESLLEMRNFGIAGLMPFQISRVVPFPMTSGNNAGKYPPYVAWKYGDKIDACTQAVQHGLQPLTIFFWPRSESVTAGEELKREVVICNDSETSRTLVAQWSLAGQPPQQARLKLSPGQQRRIPVSWMVRADSDCLTAHLSADGQIESSDRQALRVGDPQRLTAPVLKRRVMVYEGEHPGTARQLQQLGITATASREVPAIAPESLWVIAAGASDAALNRQRRRIWAYLDAGGRILCLPQEQWPRWSPVRLGFLPATRATPAYFLDFGLPKASKNVCYSCYAPIYAAGHPVFEGIAASDLRFWSPRDGRVADDIIVRPSETGAMASGSWRVLAGGCQRGFAALAEARVGAGSLVFCQAQVLQQSQTPEARLVLMNLLRYLDGTGWTPRGAHVALTGALTAGKAAELSGAPLAAFAGASPGKGEVLIATDGAAAAELAQWGEAGGTVLVLSPEVARRLPGYAVVDDDRSVYLGVHGQDHPLLWGVSSANFTDFSHSCVEGVLAKTPPSAKVLLYGLSCPAATVATGRGTSDMRRELDVFHAAAGPVAACQPRGKGQWIVTTMAPWRKPSPHNHELLNTLLANAGVDIPPAQSQLFSISVLKTAPLNIDGRLDDWTADVEDRNVSPYVHARPIVLSSEDATGGKLAGDAELSAIVYFLWNENALYLGGAVFRRGGQATLAAQIGGHALSLIPSGNKAGVQLDGRPAAALKSAFGRTISDELTDARALSLFAGIARRADALHERVPGVTFEVELPWGALGYDKPPAQIRGLIRLQRADGVAIQSPVDAAPNDPHTWLTLMLAP